MAEVVLAAFNARYAHSSFGARYLLANLGDLQSQAELLEFDLQVLPSTAVEKILALHPQVVSIGCYIWNIDLVTHVAAVLKRVRPDIQLVLGGPEISYETEVQEIFQYADYVICGEGEVEFPKLCRNLLSRRAARDTEEDVPPTARHLSTALADVNVSQAARLPCDPITDVPQIALQPSSASADVNVSQAARLPCDPATDVPQSSHLPDTTGFNPFQPVQQACRKNLPHWSQDECTYFVTFRLADSIPQTRIKEYDELRRKWEEHHQLPYTEIESEEFNTLFSERVNEWLDQGSGSCCLKKPNLSKIVADTLLHFDGERYELDEWVVMPNHVHVLVKPLGNFGLSTIVQTWKSYSAHAINKVLNRSGQLWKAESYDHIVRDVEELTRIRNYIRRNPEKAGISVDFAGSRRAARDTGEDVPPTARHLSSASADVNVSQAARLPCDPGADASPPARLLYASPVDVAQIELPYDLYSDEDIAHRAIYVEASRGCPFRCEYCMSSLDRSVRRFPSPAFFAAMERLLNRGARTFKFVDRTFNLDIPFAIEVLTFFRERQVAGLMLHVEVIPDRLPEELLDAVRQYPAGMLQFEIGIQTFNEAVAHRIQRPLNMAIIETNMRRLRAETGVHIHSDLIAGLPGEDVASFADGFDRLMALNPQEIQLGILKRLRGAPIDRHTQDWGMVYSPHAPYEILQTHQIPFEEMQRIQRFARYWNLVVNNGQFIDTAPFLWRDAASPFAAFMEFSDWLYGETNTTGNLAMLRLAKLLMKFLIDEKGMAERNVAESLWRDYQRGNRPDVPGFLKKHGFESNRQEASDANIPRTARLPRQARHLKD